MIKLAVPALLMVAFLHSALPVNAAKASSLATAISIEELEATDGSIICESGKFMLCDKEYSPQTYGVVDTTPDVAFISDRDPNKKPVTTQGVVPVRVSTINGPIVAGDYISSSTIPGVGQKATRSGYVLGIAQADYSATDPQAIDLIPVSIQTKPAIMTNRAGANLIQLIKDGIDATYLSPVLALRYMLATLVTLGSIFLAFWFFARVAHTGVQAIGRNPLAGKTIQMGIIYNVFITLGVMGVGLFLAYLLLVI